MPGVILVLGLVAAGIYTENAWFYAVAALAGIVWIFFALAVASLAATTTKTLKDFTGFTKPGNKN